MNYVLLNRADIDPSFTPILEYIDHTLPKAHYFDLIGKKLDALDPVVDTIAFNGPSWLIAMAGYHWIRNEDRSEFNFILYSKVGRTYTVLKEEIPL